MDKSKIFNINFWIFGAVILLVSAIILCMPIVLSGSGSESVNLAKQEPAWIGDAIGGITSPFVAIGAAVLTFIAFWVQYRFNATQLEFIERERFEQSFYEMLSVHESITNTLSLDIINNSVVFGRENRIIEHQEGRDVFRLLYETFPIDEDLAINRFIVPGAKQYVGLRDLFCYAEQPYKTYEYNNAVGKLDHYFRQLYRLIKMVNDNNNLSIHEKYQYTSIVRSTLSQYELILLFYNGLSNKGVTKFKTLIEDYALLKNIRPELLAKPEDQHHYSEVFKESYEYEADSTISPTQYKKKAFVPRIDET